MVRPLQQFLLEIDRSSFAMCCSATDYPVDWVIDRHSHMKHQLIYAVNGVMVVQADVGQWVVPPNRGIWMPAGMSHSIRCIGSVHMRSLFVKPGIVPHLPLESQVVSVSPLLRELIKASVDVSYPYEADSRDGRLMRLILDELRALPVLPLHLTQPTDPRLCQICEQLQRQPDDPSTLGDWALRLAVNEKTIQRLFVKETGMTFGQWRQQTRLLQALERLAHGEKVIDIALELGYDSPSAFATMFKRQFGQPPSQFFK